MSIGISVIRTVTAEPGKSTETIACVLSMGVSANQIAPERVDESLEQMEKDFASLKEEARAWRESGAIDRLVELNEALAKVPPSEV